MGLPKWNFRVRGRRLRLNRKVTIFRLYDRHIKKRLGGWHDNSLNWNDYRGVIQGTYVLANGFSH